MGGIGGGFRLQGKAELPTTNVQSDLVCPLVSTCLAARTICRPEGFLSARFGGRLRLIGRRPSGGAPLEAIRPLLFDAFYQVRLALLSTRSATPEEGREPRGVKL